MSSNGSSTAREPRDGAQQSSRAFRGLALVFVLSFLNLVGVLLTATALGGVEPWTRWQFIGMYGVLEVASGLANVVAPNIWRLPIAQLETKDTDVRLAASTLSLPHWGGLARTAAGVVLVGLAAWREGVGPATLALVPLVLSVAVMILAISALIARVGVARPDLDVVQFVVRWGPREMELRPISTGASVLQFLLAIVSIPAVKILEPSVLYQPEIGPSAAALLLAVAAAVASSALVYLAWWGRLEVNAPLEQQREAEEHS